MDLSLVRSFPALAVPKTRKAPKSRVAIPTAASFTHPDPSRTVTERPFAGAPRRQLPRPNLVAYRALEARASSPMLVAMEFRSRSQTTLQQGNVGLPPSLGRAPEGYPQSSSKSDVPYNTGQGTLNTQLQHLPVTGLMVCQGTGKRNLDLWRSHTTKGSQAIPLPEE